LKRRGWKAEELKERRKSDPEKLALGSAAQQRDDAGKPLAGGDTVLASYEWPKIRRFF